MVKIKTFNKFMVEVESTSSNKKKNTLVKDYIKEREDHGGFPVVEGENVAFVYISKNESKVSLAGDMNSWNLEANHMKRLKDVNLYYMRMKFPLDARIEYAYIEEGKFNLDPLNKRQSSGGLGPFSELQMPNYRPPNEISYDAEMPHGKIQAFRFYSKIFDNDRVVHVYLPPGYNPAKNYPVIYAQDGSDYLRFGFFDKVLDNLIKKEMIEEVLVVFVDPSNRLLEYDLNEDYVDFLTGELAPYINDNYSTRQKPSKTLVMGASFGGLISVYAAFKHPEVFGNVASQSGYLSRKKDWITRQFKNSPKKQIRLHLVCGTYETNVGQIFGNFIEGNRKMRDVLHRKRYKIVYQEFHEGHNWGNWRSSIGSILRTFFERY